MTTEIDDLRVFDAACRADFYTFFARCFLLLNPGTTFVSNWSTDAMAHFADRFALGEVRRGIVNMPPRHGKSLMFNVALCAFILGHDPRKRIFCISYAGPLSSEHGALFRTIVELPGTGACSRGCRSSGSWTTKSTPPNAATAVGPRSGAR